MSVATKINLVMGITGCSQAENTLDTLEHFEAEGLHVNFTFVVTHSAAKFFDVDQLKKYTDEKIFLDHWDSSEKFKVPHIHVSEWADVVLVYPTSANTLAKFAHGMTDNLISNIVLAAKCPVLIGPTMNDAMYDNSITQKNLKLVEEAGYHLIPRVVSPVFVKSQQKWVEKPYCSKQSVVASLKQSIEAL